MFAVPRYRPSVSLSQGRRASARPNQNTKSPIKTATTKEPQSTEFTLGTVISKRLTQHQHDAAKIQRPLFSKYQGSRHTDLSSFDKTQFKQPLISFEPQAISSDFAPVSTLTQALQLQNSGKYNNTFNTMGLIRDLDKIYAQQQQVEPPEYNEEEVREQDDKDEDVDEEDEEDEDEDAENDIPEDEEDWEEEPENP